MGKLYLIVGPSGSGKTTIVDQIKTVDDNLVGIVTCTSREPRPGEVDGVHYNFESRESFEAMIRDGGVLEYEEVHGNLYGTPAKPVRDLLENGFDVALIIDYKGARSIKKIFPESVTVFIKTTSIEELEARLIERGDSPVEISKRIRRVYEELDYSSECDHVITNRKIDWSVDLLHGIIRRNRQH